MRSIPFEELSIREAHQLLIGSIAPRPIGFASTIDKAGKVNLSPFSFFNVFGSKPATLIFSPARRGRDNTTKHTLENVLEHPEVVINIVDYSIVQQMALTSTEYDKGVNEFEKAGLTELKSERVLPPRVAESPVSFECKVKEVIAMGDQGGAGNLVICEALVGHFKEHIFDESGAIDPRKMDLVGRLGGSWYCRVVEDTLFEVKRTHKGKGIGVDQLPAHVRDSKILSGNDLGKLGNVDVLPTPALVAEFQKTARIEEVFTRYEDRKSLMAEQLHLLAKAFIENGDLDKAWMTLLQIQA